MKNLQSLCISAFLAFAVFGCNYGAAPEINKANDIPAPTKNDERPNLEFVVVFLEGTTIDELVTNGPFDIQTVRVYIEGEQYLIKIYGPSDGRIRLYAEMVLGSHPNVKSVIENTPDITKD